MATVRDLKLVNKVKPTKAILCGPGKGGDRKITVHGYIKLEVNEKSKQPRLIKMFVVDTSENLLGRPAIESLHLLNWKDDEVPGNGDSCYHDRSVDEVNSKNQLAEKSQLMSEFPSAFKGLGKFKNVTHEIKIRDEARPFAISTPRRVSFPLMDRTKRELDRMVREGVIEEIDEPTEWCAPMVVVDKGNEKVRICVDFTELNNHVMRERYQLPSVDETLGQLKNAKYFSKLDCSSGFWQIQLEEKSQKLTTFLTPFGRFYFKRIYFGITSASEVSSKHMMKLLKDLRGIKVHVDDIIITGETVDEHNCNLRSVLRILSENEVTLNLEKCHIGVTKIKYLGYELSASGIAPDSESVQSIVEFKAPTSVTEVRRFLGMFNYVTKFIPNTAAHTHNIRSLLSKKNQFMWTSAHQKEFDQLKQMLSSGPIVAFYDTERETRITTDSSSYGLGGVLEQKHEDVWKPVYFCSKSLSQTERMYAQIEKEALAVTWCCERLHQFLVGKLFTIRTDHKPLESCLGTKAIADLSPRLQRFRMRLVRFNYKISFVPGKEIFTADVLSRAPLAIGSGDEDVLSMEQMTLFIGSICAEMSSNVSVAENEVRQEQKNDVTITLIKEYIANGWPDKKKAEFSTLPFFKYRGEMTIYNDLLCYKNRIVIPDELRSKCLRNVHIGHQGVGRCRNRAKTSLWWPGIGKQIKNLIENCAICIKNSAIRHEPLMHSEMPRQPWHTVGVDLCEVKAANSDKKSTYVIVQDYYSKFLEIARLERVRSKDIIVRLKDIFARQGVPAILRSDNGGQFDSEEFREFEHVYQFKLVTSSPLHSRSNGLIESGVKTAKRILKKCDDPFLGLLAYRNTPLEGGLSPSQLLNSRIMRDILPMLTEATVPRPIDHEMVYKQMQEHQSKQKKYFDDRHAAKELKPLKSDQLVWIIDRKEEGVVRNQRPEPRSYDVETSAGTLRRNRMFLKPLPSRESVQPPTNQAQPEPIRRSVRIAARRNTLR